MAIIENEKWKNGRIKPGKLILHRCRGPPFVRSKKIRGEICESTGFAWTDIVDRVFKSASKISPFFRMSSKIDVFHPIALRGKNANVLIFIYLTFV